LETKRCETLAVFVNRVAPEGLEEFWAGGQGNPRSNLAVPELTVLAKPTVGEIAEELGATLWSGDPESLTERWKILRSGLWSFPTFSIGWSRGPRNHAGDRSDIILGSLLADAATTYPRSQGSF